MTSAPPSFHVYELLGGLAQCILQSRLDLSQQLSVPASPERDLLLKTVLPQYLELEASFSAAWDAYRAEAGSSADVGAELVLQVFAANKPLVGDAGDARPASTLLESFHLSYTFAPAPADLCSPLLAQKQLDGNTIKQCAGFVTLVRSLMSILRVLPAFSFTTAVRSSAESPLKISYQIAIKRQTAEQQPGDVPARAWDAFHAASTRLDMLPVSSELGTFLFRIEYRDKCDIDPLQPLVAQAVRQSPVRVAPSPSRGEPHTPPSQDGGSAPNLVPVASGPPAVPSLGDNDGDDDDDDDEEEELLFSNPISSSPIVEPPAQHEQQHQQQQAPAPAEAHEAPQTTLNLPLISFLAHCETAHQYRLRMFDSSTPAPSLAELQQFMRTDLARPLGVVAN